MNYKLFILFLSLGYIVELLFWLFKVLNFITCLKSCQVYPFHYNVCWRSKIDVY